MPPEAMLRVIDFGSQPPLRSQTLWHAIAHGVSAGAPTTLSFVRPSAPYVSIGYHRHLEEIDVDACRRDGLPVYRRMIGGGPVYLDADQLFFQITRPAHEVPSAGPRAMRHLLEPAARAFADVGVPASYDETGDIVVDSGKVSGTGGGQIEDAAIAVGNLIERFDHAAMAAVLGVEDEGVRDEALRLMRTHVVATPADPVAFQDALVRRYAEAFDLQPEDSELTATETAALSELDRQFTDPAWLAGPATATPRQRRIKVRAGVWVWSADVAATQVIASLTHGRLSHLTIRDPELNGGAARIEQALTGLDIDAAIEAAGSFGPIGTRVAAALAGDGRTP